MDSAAGAELAAWPCRSVCMQVGWRCRLRRPRPRPAPCPCACWGASRGDGSRLCGVLAQVKGRGGSLGSPDDGSTDSTQLESFQERLWGCRRPTRPAQGQPTSTLRCGGPAHARMQEAQRSGPGPLWPRCPRQASEERSRRGDAAGPLPGAGEVTAPSPLLGDVEHHDHPVAVLVHVQELGVQGHLRLRLGREGPA